MLVISSKGMMTPHSKKVKKHDAHNVANVIIMTYTLKQKNARVCFCRIITF